MEQDSKKEAAGKIGELVLEYIDPVIVQVTGHIDDGEHKGRLVLSYLGKRTDKLLQELTQQKEAD
jgi:hypothetical protein